MHGLGLPRAYWSEEGGKEIQGWRPGTVEPTALPRGCLALAGHYRSIYGGHKKPSSAGRLPSIVRVCGITRHLRTSALVPACLTASETATAGRKTNKHPTAGPSTHGAAPAKERQPGA